MSLYESIVDLPIEIQTLEIDRKEKQVTAQFCRRTSVITFEGADATGFGEDVIFDSALHRYPSALRSEIPGEYTFGEFSRTFDRLAVFDPDHKPTDSQRNYRRWALESAALDLALKQNELTLAEVIDEEYRPLQFVVSPSSDEQSIDGVTRLIDQVPGVELKLNAKADWDRDLIDEYAKLDPVRVVDLKSHYGEDKPGVDPDQELYENVFEGFDGDVIIEDPKVTPETRHVVDGHKERVSWDAPVTDAECIKALPFDPAYLNIKPSRFGSVASLLETIEYCRDRGITMYGGGQFELGVGRQHVQAIASLFCPTAPNDLAPRVYNGPGIPENPPQGPLRPADGGLGLEW